MATVIGVVSRVVGEVFAVAGDGTRRPLVEGDRLFAGEQLLTGAEGAISVALANGGELTLGRDSSMNLSTQLLATGNGDAPVDPTADAQQPQPPSQQDLTDVQQLQAAIEAGADPTQTGEATAAGPGAGGAGGAGGVGGGHSFVLLSETAGALDPTIGFPTGPITAGPLFPEAEILAPTDFSPELTVVFLDEEGSVVTGPGVVDEEALDGGESGGGNPGSNPGSNAETTSGTLIINSPDGIGRIEVLDAAGNWINVAGGGTVQGTYGVLVFDAAGNWTYTLTDNSLDHSNPNATGAEDQLFDNFSVRVFDLDGDVSPTVPLTIAINDDGPSAGLEFSREGGDVIIDESAGLQPGSHDVAGPLAVFDGVANPSSDMRAYAQGTAPAVIANYDFGADEGGATAVYSLALIEGEGGEGQEGPQAQAAGLTTTSGSPITLSVEGGLVVGRDADGNAAFAISIDPDTGVISVAQYQSLHHPDGSDANDSIDLSGLIRAVLTVTDGDGDKAVASADIGQLIRFVDDGPTASIQTNEGGRVSHDESAGLQNGTVTPTPGGDANDNDTNAPSVVSLFSGVSNTGTDLSSTGYATSNGAVVDISGSSTGEDNEGATTVLSLSIVDGNGSDSGLTTTDGQTIRLYLENGLIVGRVDGGDTGPGAAAFAIAIGQDGSVSVAQYISLHHPDTGSADDAVTLSGKVRAVVTVTDGDGDVDTAQVGIGGAIRFEDDGPTAVIERLEGVRVTHDESAGLQNGTATPTPQGDALDDDTSNPDVIALFAGVNNVGTDLSGYATSAGPVVSTAGTSTGEDNEGATTVLSLEITGGDGTDSGLTTTDGQVIRLYMENGLIVGRVDGGDQGPGAAVFAVAMGQDGTISVAQYMSLNHPDTGSRDEGVDLGGLVRAVVTVTDGDGDVDVAKVNIGGAIRFEDDAPTASIQAVEGARVTHDETPGLQNGTATPTPGNDANDNDTNNPSVIALFSSVADAGTALAAGYATSNGPVVDASGSSTGEDQEGATTVLSLEVQDADSGLTTLDGSSIVLTVENGLIVGRVDGGTYNGQAAFAVAIGQDGSISVAQYIPLQHPDTASHDDALNLSGKIRAVVTVTDGDGDVSTDSVGIGGAVRFEDDGPTATQVTATSVLDDEGLNGGINGGPGDVADAHTSTSGSLGYDAGADGLKSIELTGPTSLGSESVTSTWNASTNTLTISSARGDLMTVVLTDLATGAYTVNLLKPLMHTVSGTEDNITLNVGYKVTDGDGDTADGSLAVTINDDTPTLQVGALDLNSSVTFVGTDAGYSNSYGYYIKGDDGTPLSGKVIWANVHDQGNGDTFDLGNLDPASTGFFIIPDGGANGGLANGADITFQLVGGKWQAFIGSTPLTGADGANVLFSDATLNPGGSHLQDTGNAGNQNWEDKTATSDYDYNDVSTSVTWGSTLQLQVDETNLGLGATATASADFSGLFNVQPGADGLGSLDYGLEVTNPASGLVDTETGDDVVLFLENGQVVGRVGDASGEVVFTLTVGADGKVTLEQLRAIEHPTSDPDEAAFLGSGHVKLNLTVTDGDGDTASGGLDIGKVISFRDDAPSISAGEIASGELQVDETNLLVDKTVDYSTAFTSSYGADGAGSISYTLAISATGADSGLKDTASGSDIKLYLEGGQVVGRVGGPAGAISFTVTVDADGKVTLDQKLAIVHPTSDPDEATGLSAADLVKLVATITDKDGDSSSATLNLGNAISFKDDGPNIDPGPVESGSLQVDETVLGTDATRDFSGSFTHAFGNDGAGTITYALNISAPGADSGLKDTASGSDIKLYLEGGQVVGRVGGPAGAISFTVTVDADGKVTLDQKLAIVHSPNTGPDQATGLSAADLVKLTATITDKDGDTDSATVNLGNAISFKDDAPSIRAAEIPADSLQVDETFLGSNSTTDFSSAFIKNYGADGAGTTTYALDVKSQGVDSGLKDTATGSDIKLYLEGGEVVGRVGGDTGAVAFKVTVDASGKVTLDQVRAIVHSPNTGPDQESSLGAADLVKLVATITDKDGDASSATLNLGNAISFKDDAPTINAGQAQLGSLQVDETNLALNATTNFSGAFTSSYGADGAGSIGYALEVKAQGADSGLKDTASGSDIKLYLEGGEVVGRVGSDTGAVAFRVTVDASGNVTLDQVRAIVHSPNTGPDQATGLSAADLVKLVATITDKDGDASSASLNLGNAISFKDDAPTINAGQVQAGSLQVDETNLALNATTNFSGAFTSSYGADGAGSIGYALEVKAQGADSGLKDTASGSDIKLYLEGGEVVGRVGTYTGAVAFKVTVDASGNVTLDQVRAIVHSPDTGPDQAAGLSAADLVKLVATITDKDGDANSATLNLGNAISFKDDAPSINAGQAQVGSLQVDETNLALNATTNFSGAFTGNYGADGAGSIGYALEVKAQGADSGLKDTATGSDIKLYLEGGEVVGRVGTSTGAVAFKVTVDASGNVTLDQVRAIVHSPNTGPDQATGLSAADLVKLVATITDKDGDASSASLNLGNAISFKDDAPTINAGTATAASLQVDETNLALNATTNFSGSFTSNYGADGAGSIGYALEVKAQGADSGLKDTATGSDIKLYLEGGEVVGRVGSDTGAVAFKVTVDASGNVTLDQVRAIVHSPNTGPDQAIGLSAADLVKLVATITDKDGDASSASLNLGNAISFKDDAPTISAGQAQLGSLQVDETNLALNATTNYSGAFTSSYGADGAGNIGYTLEVKSPGADSGLKDTASGSDIKLYLEGGEVVGRVGTYTGAVAFKVTVDASGNVTLDQVRAIVHSPDTGPDQAAGLSAADLVKLVATITDKDGDTSSASLNLGSAISFKDDAPTTGTNQTVQLDDDALPKGIPGGVGDDADSQNASGTLSHSYGADGAGSISWVTTGAPVGFTYETSGSNLLIKQGTTTVLTVTLNSATGAYEVQQNAPIQHANADNENNQAFQITYKVTDKDGDSANGTLNINVDDDTPVAQNDTATVQASQGQAINMVFVLDFSGSINNTELGQMLDAVKAAGQALFAGSTGDVQLQIVAFSGDATSYAPVTSYAAFESLVNSLDPSEPGGVRPYSGNTDFTAAIEKTMDAFNPLPGWNNQVVFISDGNPNEQTQNGNALLNQTALDWQQFITSNHINVTSIGVGDGIDNDNLQDVDLDGSGAPILIGGFTDLVNTLLSQVTSNLVSGNVISGSDGVAGTADDDGFGADGPGRILSIEINNVTYTWNGSNSISSSAGGSPISGNSLTNVTTAQGGKLSFNFSTGAWTYQTPSEVVGDKQENFKYTIVDRDGDPSSATLSVYVVDSSPVIASVDEDELPGGITDGDAVTTVATGSVVDLVIGSPSGVTFSLASNTSGVTPASSDGHPLVYTVSGNTLTATAGAGGATVFTLQLQANGSFTLTLSGPLDHPLGNGDDGETLTLNLSSLIQASNGSSPVPMAGDFLIRVEDDVPSIGVGNVAGTGVLQVDESNLALNATVSFAANFNASYGGDGAGSITYKLDISASGTNSGLKDTASGSDIKLYLEGGEVVGRVGSSTGAIAFKVTVDASGNVTLDQQRAIAHTPNSGPDQAAGLSAADLVKLIATITDNDGDKSSATLNLGNAISFKDDAPTISAGSATAGSLQVDESNLAGNATASFASSFSGNYGADGAGTTTYALKVSAAGVDSGLDDSATGSDIKLYLEGTDVVGRVGSSTGAIAFKVTVDAATGSVTLDQVRSVMHTPNTGPDQAVSLGAADLVQLVATITDKDGDASSANLNLGSAISFKDDAPTISAGTATAASLQVDETNLAANASVNLSGQFTGNYGADGAGTTTYALKVSAAGVDSGLDDSATGSDIKLYLEGTEVVGRVGSSTGAIAFKVTVDSATGLVTLDQQRAIIHTPNSGPDQAVSLGAADLVQLVATITDKDGDANSASLNLGSAISFKDDAPSISAGTATAASLQVDETSLSLDATVNFASSFTGNYGADGAGTTTYALKVSAAGVDSGLDDTASGSDIKLYLEGNDVVGRVGSATGAIAFKVTVDASGNVTLDQQRAIVHTPNTGPDQAVSLSAANLVQLVATITDKDGDSNSATLNLGSAISFKDDAPSISAGVAQAGSLQVDETNLAGNASTSFASSFTSNPGADGAASTTYALKVSSAGVDSGLDDSATGSDIKLFLEGTQVVGRVGSSTGAISFTLTVDAAGSVTLDQQRAVIHTPNSGPDQAVSLGAADLVQLVATITDKDGDTSSASLNLGSAISFRDDAPTAANQTQNGQASVNLNSNLMLVLDISGSMGDASGVGSMDRLQVAKNALLELLEQYDALGDVRVSFVTFSTTATTEAVWVSVADAKAAILGVSTENTTNYDAALISAINAYGNAGKLATGNVQNVAYFLSDGYPNQPSGDEGISNANGSASGWPTPYSNGNVSEEQAWINFLTANNIRAYALGMGTGVDATALNPIAYNGTNGGSNTNAIVVTDLNALTSTLVATAQASPISGSLVSGGSMGNDGGYVRSIVVDGKTYTYDKATGTFTASGPGSNNGSLSGSLLTVSMGSGSSIMVNMLNGAYTYTPPSTINLAIATSIAFTLLDNDGDSASANLNININSGTQPMVIRDDLVLTNVPAQTGADQILIPTWALLANDTGPSAGLLSVLSVASIGSDGASLGAGNVTFTENSSNSTNGGSFSYGVSVDGSTTLDTAVVDVVRDAGANTLNGTFRNEILLGRDGANDTLNGGDGDDVLIGQGGNDTLNGGNGNDILVGGAGNDVLNGGAGVDTASYIDAPSGVTVDLSILVAQNTGGGGTDTLSSIENLIGSNFADVLKGDNNANVLFGGAGNDTLLGGGGDDFLIGGLGADTMSGGAGKDTFIWQKGGLGGGVDHITDFTVDITGANSDVLDLSQLLSGVGTAPNVLDSYLNFSFSGTTTTIDIKTEAAGPVQQQVVLDNVNLSTLYGTTNEATIIGNLLDDHALKTTV